jgi:hypothetical protein
VTRSPVPGDVVELFYGCKSTPWKAYPVTSVDGETFTAGGCEYNLTEVGATWRWPAESSS